MDNTMPPPIKRRQSCNLADSLIALLALRRRSERVTVDDCIGVLGENSILLGLMLFTLLSSLPLFGIPGFTTLTGVPIVLLGSQLLTAREGIWLPASIRRRSLSSAKLWNWMQKILPSVRKGERLLKPRIAVMSSQPMHYVAGVFFIAMGILLALPIPFINFPAGFSMFVLAVGLVERDGVLICIGLTAMTILFAGVTYVFTQMLGVAGAINWPLI